MKWKRGDFEVQKVDDYDSSQSLSLQIREESFVIAKNIGVYLYALLVQSSFNVRSLECIQQMALVASRTVLYATNQRIAHSVQPINNSHALRKACEVWENKYVSTQGRYAWLRLESFMVF